MIKTLVARDLNYILLITRSGFFTELPQITVKQSPSKHVASYLSKAEPLNHRWDFCPDVTRQESHELCS